MSKYISDIESFPARLTAEVENLTDEQLDTPYRPDGWTIRQVVNHCADSHMNGLIRHKLLLTENKPTIKPYIENLWAELPDSKSMPIESAIQILLGVHKRWTVLLKSLSKDDLKRTYIHPGTWKRISVGRKYCTLCLALQPSSCTYNRIKKTQKLEIKMRKILLSLYLIGFGIIGFAQETEYQTKLNIPYYSDLVNQSDEYIKERCVLDVYYPSNLKNFPTIVWFHGGGLTGGEKEIPAALKEKGFCVVGVNYRLYPKVKSPKYLEDAAAAVAWVFNNIRDFGGDTSLIFVSGYSAGGYLTNMIGLDKRWLKIS